jgi:hypothetical protein
MRRVCGVVAIVLGATGTLVCAAAIGLGWWAAAEANDRVGDAAARVEHYLNEADDGLARVEGRLEALRADFEEARRSAEALVADNPELPRVRSAVDQLLDRLAPALDRAAALADSLRAVAAGLRAAADVRAQFGRGTPADGRAVAAAEAIEKAAGLLAVPRAKVEAARSAAGVRITRELMAAATATAAGSEKLAAGLADARREIAAARGWTAGCRDRVGVWAYATAAAHSGLWGWAGIGQVCLLGWGWRRVIRHRSPPATTGCAATEGGAHRADQRRQPS